MAARDTLGILRIEDGRLWVDAAADFQVQDLEAILDGPLPYHYITRARGSSKTSDLAACAIALLLDAGVRERFYWIASDVDQGRLAIDAVLGFMIRTPALRDALIVT